MSYINTINDFVEPGVMEDWNTGYKKEEAREAILQGLDAGLETIEYLLENKMYSPQANPLMEIIWITEQIKFYSNPDN